MLKYINSLTIASVIIILAMGAADYIMSDRIDLVRLSASACAPILTLALYRWATKASPRVVIKRK
jgi:ribose/xylose/arabinose/galactoside ABC-type transport system permease subunit